MATKPILTEVEKLYSVKEVAGMLSSHPNYVYGIIRSHEIDAIRKGGKRGAWLVPHSAVLKWMNEHLQPAKRA